MFCPPSVLSLPEKKNDRKEKRKEGRTKGKKGGKKRNKIVTKKERIKKTLSVCMSMSLLVLEICLIYHKAGYRVGA